MHVRVYVCACIHACVCVRVCGCVFDILYYGSQELEEEKERLLVAMEEAKRSKYKQFNPVCVLYCFRFYEPCVYACLPWQLFPAVLLESFTFILFHTQPPHALMYIYTHARTHTYTHKHTHTHMHSRMHTCTHAHIRTYVHTYIHAHAHTGTEALDSEYKNAKAQLEANDTHIQVRHH